MERLKTVKSFKKGQDHMEQNRVLDVLTSKELTYEQKVFSLAREAEDSLEVLDIPPKTRQYFETGALND